MPRPCVSRRWLPCCLLSPLTLILFPSLLLQSSLSPKGRDLIETFPLALQSLTLCPMPRYGSIYLFPSTPGGIFLRQSISLSHDLSSKLVWWPVSPRKQPDTASELRLQVPANTRSFRLVSFLISEIPPSVVGL